MCVSFVNFVVNEFARLHVQAGIQEVAVPQADVRVRLNDAIVVNLATGISFVIRTLAIFFGEVLAKLLEILVVRAKLAT